MTILFFGPIAVPNQPARGGFEAANRKNIDVLREIGVNVIEFANPQIKYKFGALAKLAYIKLFFLPFYVFKYYGRKDVIIHHTPLYRNLLLASVFLVFIAKLNGIPVLLDIRGGSLINLKGQRSILWYKGVQYILKNSSRITVEGKSYISDIKKVFKIDKEILYFPNITYCNDVIYHIRKENTFNLIYFGRITKLKGIKIMLDAISKLDNRFRLYLAGAIDDDIYSNIFSIKNVIYLGNLSYGELLNQLQKMHIFIFPTRWPGEGQSNSLIEAMQNGLIPITSDQGFCSDVVGECGVVLPVDSDANAYINEIMKIVSNSLEEQGKKAMQHIIDNHNIHKWIPWLVEQYEDILSKNFMYSK